MLLCPLIPQNGNDTYYKHCKGAQKCYPLKTAQPDAMEYIPEMRSEINC